MPPASCCSKLKGVHKSEVTEAILLFTNLLLSYYLLLEHSYSGTAHAGSEESDAQLTQLLTSIPGNGVQDADYFQGQLL